MYAIIRTGGKQYRVAENTVFSVEKLEAEDGAEVALTDVLLVGEGENVRVGSPTVPGARVTARVIETFKGRKIRGYTYRPTKGTQRHYGHRQWQTRLKVVKIEG